MDTSAAIEIYIRVILVDTHNRKYPLMYTPLSVSCSSTFDEILRYKIQPTHWQFHNWHSCVEFEKYGDKRNTTAKMVSIGNKIDKLYGMGYKNYSFFTKVKQSQLDTIKRLTFNDNNDNHNNDLSLYEIFFILKEKYFSLIIFLILLIFLVAIFFLLYNLYNNQPRFFFYYCIR